MTNYYRKNSNARSRSASKKEGQRWFWMLFGSLIGGLSVFLVLGFYTELLSLDQLKSYIHAKTASPSRVSASQAQPKVLARPRAEQIAKKEAQDYEFYTLLPGREVQSPPPSQKSKNSANTELKHSQKQTPRPEEARNNAKTNDKTNAKIKVTSTAERKMEDKKNIEVEKEKDKEKTNVLSKSVAQYIIQTGIFQEIKDADALKARLTLQGFNTQVQKVQVQDGQTFFRVTLGPFVSESQAKQEKKRLEEYKIRGILILQRQ